MQCRCLSWRKPITAVLLALQLMLLGAFAEASDSSGKRYAEAIELEKKGQMDQAERLYGKILIEYPNTESAARAAAQIERIGRRRAQAYKDEFIPVLNRVQQLLEGYWSAAARYPRQLADFDRDDYPFTTDYLAGTVPEGFRVVLALGAKQLPYRIWALKDGFEDGFLVDGSSPALHPVSRAQMKAFLAEGFSPEGEKGRLQFYRGR